jgi:hypothetical protein
MKPKGENQNSELQDIREILAVIVQRMVTKEEFNAVLDRMVTKEELSLHSMRNWWRFKPKHGRISEPCERISRIGVKKRNLNLTTFLAVLNTSSKSSVSRAVSEK